jgi:hypothetical protein
MHQTLRKIVRILDGKPAKTRGQSLVEMTVTFPLLILMVLSLVEVGFVANNYMVLMDVVRGAGRAAVNLNPLTFPTKGSPTGYINGDARNWERMDCDGVPGEYHLFSKDSTNTDPGNKIRGQHLASLGYSKTNDDPEFGFFDEVVCQAMRSLAPLSFNDSDTGKDDIVISAISYSLMDYSTIGSRGTGYAAGPGAHGDYWVTVTGRWPLENRYCAGTDGTGKQFGDIRDPFDYKTQDFNTAWTRGSNNGNEGAPDGSILTPTQNQSVRGFVFTGHAKDANGCYGSEFTVQDIEQRLNIDTTYNKDVPNGGLVIVEFFWQHHPLFLGPIFQGFTGNPVNDPVLHVWGWFPVMAVEPTPTPVP